MRPRAIAYRDEAVSEHCNEYEFGDLKIEHCNSTESRQLEQVNLNTIAVWKWNSGCWQA